MTEDQTLLNPASSLAALLAAPMRPGLVAWIGLRPVRREPLLAMPHADLDPADGLRGDHYGNHTTRTRQVTLMQTEHLGAIAAYLGRDFIEPALLRRNILVSGINLRALIKQEFRLGSAVLLATGECHPCSRMEKLLGPGGCNAVRGHGGITARILGRGRVQLGDEIARLDSMALP
jgi:MOSC domain-containing protein YiiM